ncbi:MAG: caspase family protein [Deltaproteobacteria bacterium]|nr:caspase family protein [Deltaproteobacteria bacterium]
MKWGWGLLFIVGSVLYGCFPTVQAPTVIPVSDLAPSVSGDVVAREPLYTVIVDRFRDGRSNRGILGQYDNLGKGGFAGTVTITSDRDITEVFEGLVKNSLNRKGILQGPSPFILRGLIKRANVGASPDSQVIKAEVFLELTIINSATGAYIWKKSFLGAASGIDPKITLANAFQDLAKVVDQDDSLLALRQIYIASGGKLPEIQTASQFAVQAAIKQAVSDVDELPAVKATQNKHAYAIIIGIERYRQKLPSADFATHDAEIVAEYLTKVMGYPMENVIVLLNDKASKNDFDKYLGRWLLNNVEKDSSVFIYYSGHGAPNPTTGDAYLVPYDGDPSFIDDTGYSLQKLYGLLGRLPARKITVALDSCFSGAGGRSVLAKGARPIVMTLQNALIIPQNVTVMAAASNSQISSTYEEKSHGLFTYFMLKGIKDTDVVDRDGSLAVGDLFTYVKPQVERIARKQYNNMQTPQLMGVKVSQNQ